MSLTPEDELLLLVTSDIDPKLKVPALEYVLGLTSTEDGIRLLQGNDKFLTFLVMSLDTEVLTNLVLKCLVNLSSSDSVLTKLLTGEINLIPKILKLLTCNKDDSSNTMSSMILSNITRKEIGAQMALDNLGNFGGMEKLAQLLCAGTPYSSFHYVASVLSNFTQVTNGRRFLLDGKEPLIKRILPFTLYMDSEVRRSGIVAAIRNCCFDTDYHELLLSESMNLLPSLLLPLAGPEEFDEDDMEKLPLDLQYLEEDKKRDPNPDNRKMLLEALTQLCATKEGRGFMRDKNVYVILRELHKWEKAAPVIVACENLVDILIGDEPQPGMENLKHVDIPSELIEKFERMDEELLKIN